VEDDVDFLAIRLPCNKHNVRISLSFDQRLSSASKDFNLYRDFSSFDGFGDSKTS
jgi:hypothetical protein